MQSFRFHPAVAQWFEQTFGTPTEPQRSGWPAIRSGAHTLLAAPTGSGKTLAAFLAALDQLFRDGLEGTLKGEIRVLYVSPLKALSNDIHKNLEEPLAGIRAVLCASEDRDVSVRAEVRTGDTPAAKRQAIARTPPHILVTTPESFYLLLTSPRARRLLTTVRTLIVDEIHALVGNRRGSHLALSMERLASLTNAPLQRIGLSATQKPIEEVARFLVGARQIDEIGNARCTIVDCGYARKLDLAIELPGSPLEAVMSNEVWAEVYGRLADLIAAHQTTLVFVNTRRLAERVTHHLCELLGKDKVTSHHGSLSAKLRLEAEHRLKRGELKALVATASLELGIDIGSIDLVCQLGATRSIATFLQRVGRAEHRRGGMPKGRLFPLRRDELVEGVATFRSLRIQELDAVEMPQNPLDLLAQQMVACVASEDWEEEQLFELVRSAYPYRNLTRKEFADVLRMVAEGFSTRRGRRSSLIHHDAVNHRVRGRRGARLLALTSGGAIPDNADYRVVVEPSETLIGTVNEDFAVESMAGDVFQLGNTAYRILRVERSTVRVEDAQGMAPTIPFWLGEAPGRTDELSQSVSRLRSEIAARLPSDPAGGSSLLWLVDEVGIAKPAAEQLGAYLASGHAALGVLPTHDTLVIERFFDEVGGMQLVIHSPYGSRINRAWGLALRKRFCRKFNFELQAAATEDNIVLSLTSAHSFDLGEVPRYLHSASIRHLLIEALLDAPMFITRWRWVAGVSLALPRFRGGRKVPPQLARLNAEDLIATIFPDQLACAENLVGEREIPDHPLVRQTIADCLVEAMDIDGLDRILTRLEAGEIDVVTRDLTEPSPLALEVLSARPYAYLDDAPLEERRTQAVMGRRWLAPEAAAELGRLDPEAIARVREEAWPDATNADELHDALMWFGFLTQEEAQARESWRDWLAALAQQRRVTRLCMPGASFFIAAERVPQFRAVWPLAAVEPTVVPPAALASPEWTQDAALLQIVRGRLGGQGALTQHALGRALPVAPAALAAALAALEAEGFALRGRFSADVAEDEWCERRLLARIHHYTLKRLRAEIEPVAGRDFVRFLLEWQKVAADARMEGPEAIDK